MRVLYIGDDRELAEMTGKLFQRNHYETDVSVGIGEALPVLDRGDYRLIVMDCDRDAAYLSSVCRELRLQNPTSYLLVLTGNQEDEVSLLRAGADDWLKKPYRFDVLLARMAALLRNQR